MSCSNKHFIKNTKKVHVLALTISLLLLAVVPIQSVSAAQITKSITTTGSQTFSYRDIADSNPTPEPTISYSGKSGLLTITDFNGDLDVTALDTVTATVGSNPVVLTETGVNSKDFTAVLVLSGDTNIIYNPDPPESARATVTLDFSSIGDLTISDVIIDNNEIANMCFRPVIHALSVGLANGATLTSTDTVVKLSYANAIFLPGDDPTLLKMYYKKTGQGWASLQPLTTFGFFGTYDFTAKTITSDPAGGAFLGQVTTGQFVLGFDTGCGGGGAGGLVRPGLVINALAGLPFGSGGKDTSPPSLAFSKPSVTGLSFLDTILGTFSIDPYDPIAPSTDSSANAPVIINDNRFYPTGYASTFVPTPVNTGEDVDLTLNFLEASSVQHVAVHFVDINNDEMSDTDPTITYDNGNVIKSDPDGILGDEITFSTLREGSHSKFNFGFSFDQPTKRHLMVTAWDEMRNSANTKMFNVFEVTGEPIPEEVGHLILQDLGQYIITQDGVIDVQAKNPIQQEPVVGFAYEESLGRLDRHDMTKLYGAIDYEQKRAGDLISNFGLDTKRFVADDETKPYDISSKRAPQLTWSNVGHKLRDLANTPENEEMIKELCWQQHLKAEKTLKSLLVGSKYHQD